MPNHVARSYQSDVRPELSFGTERRIPRDLLEQTGVSLPDLTPCSALLLDIGR